MSLGAFSEFFTTVFILLLFSRQSCERKVNYHYIELKSSLKVIIKAWTKSLEAFSEFYTPVFILLLLSPQCFERKVNLNHYIEFKSSLFSAKVIIMAWTKSLGAFSGFFPTVFILRLFSRQSCERKFNYHYIEIKSSLYSAKVLDKIPRGPRVISEYFTTVLLLLFFCLSLCCKVLNYYTRLKSP